MNKLKKIIPLFIPVLIPILIISLSFTEQIKNLERKIYDILLLIKPGIEEDKDLLLVTIDDPTIAEVNMYPIGRDIMADGVIVLKELGTERVCFDIEFVDKSPRGINEDYLKKELPLFFQESFQSLEDFALQLGQAIQSGQVPSSAAPDYLEELANYLKQAETTLLEQINKVSQDNDSYLGKAVAFFGKVYPTINMLDEKDPTVSKELEELAIKKGAIKQMEIKGNPFRKAGGTRPSIIPVLSHSAGGGFPRVYVDPDGVRRQIDLIYDYEGNFFPQLGFAALLDWYQVDKIVSYPNSLVLQGAKDPRTKKTMDIRIPLNENGRMYINWPKKKFLDSFKQLSWIKLYWHQQFIQDLVANLQIMGDYGFLNMYDGSQPLELYQQAENLLNEALDKHDNSSSQDYRQLRDQFLSSVQTMLDSNLEAGIISEIEYILNSQDLAEADRQQWQEVKDAVPLLFTESRSKLKEIMQVRQEIIKKAENSFCIIGYTGTSTTDIGVNPFESEYMNTGTYHSVVNTIIQRNFIDDLPWWAAALIALIGSAALAFFINRLTPGTSIAVGGSFILFGVGLLTLLFCLTGIFPGILVPAVSWVLVFSSLAGQKFILASREKGFIRNAFAQYLSNDVISEILEDPQKLGLGGEEKYMTAMFTDIKGFSTISEQLSPPQLVKLLNEYLTKMSDLVLDNKGTIDKYEGDAIIAFFGAPTALPDHAEAACRSAIMMKKTEAILNQSFEDGTNTLSPSPLFTRIGINTGFMVVGNMGTERKMDYTIMGSSVNLAARLEGVNKQYGTWILISEETYKQTGDLFTVRRLDRVRVVGINQPVRLYQLIDEKNHTEKDFLKTLQIFEDGLDLFEEQKWQEAAPVFKEVLEIWKGDGPASKYLERCLEYQKTPPKGNWDGVYNLTSK